MEEIWLAAARDPVRAPGTEPAPARETSGPPAFVSVAVEPAQLPADGRSEALVLIFVADAEGHPVADGTRVAVETSLGTLSAAAGRTREGLVRLALVAPEQPEEGQVVARVGDLSDAASFTAGRTGGVRVSDPTTSPALDVAAVVQRVRNRMRPTDRGQWAVANRCYTATFGTAGFDLALKEDDDEEEAVREAAGGVRFSFHLVEIQLGEETLYRDRGRSADLEVDGNEARYRRTPIIEESYLARNHGLQQRFTLEEPPAGAGDLVIRGLLDTHLRPEIISSEEGLRFHLPGASLEDENAGSGVLRYTGALVQDARGRAIYARLALEGYHLSLTVPGEWLAAAAYPVIIDPMIGDPGLISDPRDMQGELDLAYNPDDDEYLVVWSGYDTGGASADLEGQRVQADGTLVGDLIVVAQASGDQTLPAVTYNPDQDEYLVVWTDYRNDVDGDVYGQRVAANGSLAGDNFALGATEALQDTPGVTYNPDDDLYLAVWRDRRGPAIYVYGQSSRPQVCSRGPTSRSTTAGGTTTIPAWLTARRPASSWSCGLAGGPTSTGSACRAAARSWTTPAPRGMSLIRRSPSSSATTAAARTSRPWRPTT